MNNRILWILKAAKTWPSQENERCFRDFRSKNQVSNVWLPGCWTTEHFVMQLIWTCKTGTVNSVDERSSQSCSKDSERFENSVFLLFHSFFLFASGWRSYCYYNNRFIHVVIIYVTTLFLFWRFLSLITSDTVSFTFLKQNVELIL